MTFSLATTIIGTQLAYRSFVTPDEISIVAYLEDSEDPIFLIEVFTPNGSLQLMGEFEIGERDLVIRKAHLGGDSSIKWGPKLLRQLGRAIAEKLDVDEIEVHGAVRSTGANPGRPPNVIRFSRSTEPHPRPGG